MDYAFRRRSYSADELWRASDLSDSETGSDSMSSWDSNNWYISEDEPCSEPGDCQDNWPEPNEEPLCNRDLGLAKFASICQKYQHACLSNVFSVWRVAVRCPRLAYLFANGADCDLKSGWRAHRR